MLQQFRRAIGVAIVRENAKHKLGCLHYVCAFLASGYEMWTVMHEIPISSPPS
jgi:hypothetical protein